jgi:hypothetical protein
MTAASSSYCRSPSASAAPRRRAIALMCGHPSMMAGNDTSATQMGKRPGLHVNQAVRREVRAGVIRSFDFQIALRLCGYAGYELLLLLIPIRCSSCCNLIGEQPVIFPFDDRVTLAGAPLQPGAAQHRDVAAHISDQSGLL